MTAPERCGAIQPGNWASWVPFCDLPAGHDGKHECPAYITLGTPSWWPSRYEWDGRLLGSGRLVFPKTTAAPDA